MRTLVAPVARLATLALALAGCVGDPTAPPPAPAPPGRQATAPPDVEWQITCNADGTSTTER